MREDQIVPTGLYAVKRAGRYGPIERLVVRIEKTASYGLNITSVYYRVRRGEGPFSLYLYRCSLEHFAHTALHQVDSGSMPPSPDCTGGVLGG